MISNTKTVAISAIAIVAVIALFAATPFVVAHQAQAFRGGFGGFRGGFGRFGGFGFGGGFFPDGVAAGADGAVALVGAAPGKTGPSLFIF